ncbi:uncharacterized protein MEPE_03734 [Melanopsichium pennsylvanicum]|uniref:Uncharacterized protein n=1 Tax=Melanopsichium pennsylvanicum TaxID=63383 RepID=A0AAJ4XLZ5_9BASI|nr:uncharacterized protein MEPE_03734 [Melanopsichium pennsylvanicum]
MTAHQYLKRRPERAWSQMSTHDCIADKVEPMSATGVHLDVPQPLSHVAQAGHLSVAWSDRGFYVYGR